MLLSLALSSVLVSSPAEGPHWVADFAEAQEMAKEQGKDLLINFTGSDWCGWCIKLDEEVFSQPGFAEKSEEDFVYVYLDFPNGEGAKAKVVDPELNEKLQDQYGVGGFPTIVLADHEGRPYAKTGYQAGGPENYLSSLADLRKGGQKVKALTSAEKPTAEQMMAAFPFLAEQNLLGYPAYEKFLAKAKELDPDGKKGLLRHVLAMEQNKAFEEYLEKNLPRGSQPDEATLDALALYMAKHEYLSGQTFIQLGLQVAMGHLAPKERFDEAIALIQRIKGQPDLAENEQAQTQLQAMIDDLEAKKGAQGEGDGDG